MDVEVVQHRVADSRVLRLIQKWLKAGVMEAGVWSKAEVGTPQGAVISPLLANIYLHYVFDPWVEAWRKKWRQGDFRERLKKLLPGASPLHPDKTRLIEFGGFAEKNRKQRGEGKPETFDFLGFTHINGKDRNGNFTVRRKTIVKRMRAKLQEVKQRLRSRMHEPIEQTGEWLKSIVRGYFNYHAIPGNIDSLTCLT